MGALYNHAKTEIDRLDTSEDPKFYRMILKVVSAFASYGHSGGSANVAISMVSDLLQFKNLTPITDDPDEWYAHGPVGPNNIDFWQCKRCPEAFSTDGGKTYYLLSETDDGEPDLIADNMHTSEVSGKAVLEEIFEDDNSETLEGLDGQPVVVKELDEQQLADQEDKPLPGEYDEPLDLELLSDNETIVDSSGKEVATIKDGRVVNLSLDAEEGPGGGRVISVGREGDNEEGGDNVGASTG